MKRWKIAIAGVAVGLSALAAGFATHLASNKPKTAQTSQGHKVARFLAAPLPDLQNKARKPDEWAGKIRVINFWATWCPPCRDEIPVFIQAQKAWGAKNVQIIGVAIDNAAAVRGFSKKLGINYPSLLAEENGVQIMQDLGNHIGALPFTMIVDGQGKVVQLYAGPVNKELLDSWLKKAAAPKRG